MFRFENCIDERKTRGLNSLYSRSNKVVWQVSKPSIFMALICLCSFVSATELRQKRNSHQLQMIEQLGQSLEEISMKSAVGVKLLSVTDHTVKISYPPVFSHHEPNKISGQNLLDTLPALSTDSTKINPVDITAFGFDIPESRSNHPQGRGVSSTSIEKKKDSLKPFSIRKVRFGKDKYDSNLFVVDGNNF